MLFRSVHELQSEERGVHPEWIQSGLQGAYRVGSNIGGLSRPELILERRLYVRMNQKLDPRREAAAGGTEWSEERRAAGETEAVDAVGAGVHPVPAHNEHRPRERKKIRLHKTAVELRWHARNELHRQRTGGGNRKLNQLSRGIYGEHVVIASEHVKPVDVQLPVVETEVGAGAIVWLAHVQERRLGASRCPQETLARVPPQIESPEVEIGVIAWPGWPGSLHRVAAFRVALQVEAVCQAGVNGFSTRIGCKADAAVRSPGRRRHEHAGVVGLAYAARVLIDDRHRIVVAAVHVSTAQLDTSCGARERELVGNVLLPRQRVDRADVALAVNVVRAEIHAPGLTERQVELELTGPEMEGIRRKVQEAADVYEFQIAVAQAPGRIASANAGVVIHPEGDVAPEVSRHENAEQSGLEIGGRDELGNGVRSDRNIVEVVPIPAGDLKEVVHAQPDRRKAWNRTGPNGFRPHVFLRGRA